MPSAAEGSAAEPSTSARAAPSKPRPALPAPQLRAPGPPLVIECIGGVQLYKLHNAHILETLRPGSALKRPPGKSNRWLFVMGQKLFVAKQRQKASLLHFARQAPRFELPPDGMAETLFPAKTATRRAPPGTPAAACPEGYLIIAEAIPSTIAPDDWIDESAPPVAPPKKRVRDPVPDPPPDVLRCRKRAHAPAAPAGADAVRGRLRASSSARAAGRQTALRVPRGRPRKQAGPKRVARVSVGAAPSTSGAAAPHAVAPQAEAADRCPDAGGAGAASSAAIANAPSGRADDDDEDGDVRYIPFKRRPLARRRGALEGVILWPGHPQSGVRPKKSGGRDGRSVVRFIVPAGEPVVASGSGAGEEPLPGVGVSRRITAQQLSPANRRSAEPTRPDSDASKPLPPPREAPGASGLATCSGEGLQRGKRPAPEPLVSTSNQTGAPQGAAAAPPRHQRAQQQDQPAAPSSSRAHNFIDLCDDDDEDHDEPTAPPPLPSNQAAAGQQGAGVTAANGIAHPEAADLAAHTSATPPRSPSAGAPSAEIQGAAVEPAPPVALKIESSDAAGTVAGAATGQAAAGASSAPSRGEDAAGRDGRAPVRTDSSVSAADGVRRHSAEQRLAGDGSRVPTSNASGFESVVAGPAEQHSRDEPLAGAALGRSQRGDAGAGFDSAPSGLTPAIQGDGDVRRPAAAVRPAPSGASVGGKDLSLCAAAAHQAAGQPEGVDGATKPSAAAAGTVALDTTVPGVQEPAEVVGKNDANNRAARFAGRESGSDANGRGGDAARRRMHSAGSAPALHPEEARRGSRGLEALRAIARTGVPLAGSALAAALHSASLESSRRREPLADVEPEAGDVPDARSAGGTHPQRIEPWCAPRAAADGSRPAKRPRPGSELPARSGLAAVVRKQAAAAPENTARARGKCCGGEAVESVIVPAKPARGGAAPGKVARQDKGAAMAGVLCASKKRSRGSSMVNHCGSAP